VNLFPNYCTTSYKGYSYGFSLCTWKSSGNSLRHNIIIGKQ
jgi:hypothetical protein